MGLSLWHIILVICVLLLLPLHQLPALWVLKKAGWPWWYFLLLAIPLVGIIWLYVFAFGKWTPRADTTAVNG